MIRPVWESPRRFRLLDTRPNGVSAEVAAAWLHHRFTQIHPFQDGNGRVARALASLVLIKEGLFPLVVTRDDRHSYISALEAADHGNLKPLVELFAKLQRTQFAKATAVSEAVLAESADVRAVLGGLMKAAEKAAADRRQAFRKVFEWAGILESDVRDRLGAIVPDVTAALTKVREDASVFVTVSSPQTNHYYRAEIIENAKNHLHYFADTSEYRSWVALNMLWERRAWLVFAFHGIGRFNGSLICAPFLDFRDTDEEGQTRFTLVPVAEEGFVFFYNNTEDRLLRRFRSWREQVLKVALKELSQNL